MAAFYLTSFAKAALKRNSIPNIFKQNFSKQNSNTMSKKALVILSPGAEEMEFTIATDVLRRAGVEVTVAGLCGLEPVKCSRDVRILPDASLEDSAKKCFDLIVLPGGLDGAKNMADSKLVGEILKKQAEECRLIAAICAAPTVLLTHNIALGKCLTSYPAFKEQLSSKYKYDDESNVVHDDNLITSRGPATSFEFALKLSEILTSPEKANEVAKEMLIKNQ